MTKRTAPKELRDCAVCNNRPTVTLIKRITTIPDMIMFDEDNLYYKVGCKTCKNEGTPNETKEYHKKEDAFKEWNQTNTASCLKVSQKGKT